LTVEALRRGDPQVLAALLEQHGREIQGVAYLILRNRADAEDVLMEVQSNGAAESRMATVVIQVYSDHADRVCAVTRVERPYHPARGGTDNASRSQR
jgi:hypothetical protein